MIGGRVGAMPHIDQESSIYLKQMNWFIMRKLCLTEEADHEQGKVEIPGVWSISTEWDR